MRLRQRKSTFNSTMWVDVEKAYDENGPGYCIEAEIEYTANTPESDSRHCPGRPAYAEIGDIVKIECYDVWFTPQQHFSFKLTAEVLENAKEIVEKHLAENHDEIENECLKDANNKTEIYDLGVKSAPK